MPISPPPDGLTSQWKRRRALYLTSVYSMTWHLCPPRGRGLTMHRPIAEFLHALFIQPSHLRRACLDIGKHGLFSPRPAGVLIPQPPGQAPLIRLIVGNGVDGTIVDNA